MDRTTRVFIDGNHLNSFDDGQKDENEDLDFETDSLNTTAGGFRSCLKDMSLLSSFLYKISCGSKILGQLNKISFQQMIEPIPKITENINDKNDYGMGFINEKGKIGHNGMNGSYLSSFNLNLNTGKSSIGFVNAMKDGGNPDVDSIVPIVKSLI